LLTLDNAYAERFVRTIKESCLERMILFGEGSLRKAIHEFMKHYLVVVRSADCRYYERIGTQEVLVQFSRENRF
jgi:hypothetical protein